MTQEDLDDFLEFIDNKPKLKVIQPRDEGDLDDFILATQEEIPALPVCEDPEAQVTRILTHVPTALPSYVQQLVQRSPSAFIQTLLSPMNARTTVPRNRILEFGYVTAKKIHPLDPRGIRCLSDLGLPLKKEWVIEDGRRCVAYTFEPERFIKQRRHRVATVKIRNALAKLRNYTCEICKNVYPLSFLECDHRITYAISGDENIEALGLEAFQLLCLSCNRRKLIECRRCPNTLPEKCGRCFWASPDDYDHIATVPVKYFVRVTTPDKYNQLVDYAKVLGI